MMYLESIKFKSWNPRPWVAEVSQDVANEKVKMNFDIESRKRDECLIFLAESGKIYAAGQPGSRTIYFEILDDGEINTIGDRGAVVDYFYFKRRPYEKDQKEGRCANE